tara:strand:- start:38396 stop:38638 length:243 start_codon:yes stop_codon:yes gene_type:complete
MRCRVFTVRTVGGSVFRDNRHFSEGTVAQAADGLRTHWNLCAGDDDAAKVASITFQHNIEETDIASRVDKILASKGSAEA